jgi:peptidoglycan/LPS O-acetylase OafA/YrhL
MEVEVEFNQREANTFIMLDRFFRWISFGLAIMALTARVSLLISDAKIWSPPGVPAAVISAAPLLLIGISFLFMQPILRPQSADLMKNILLAGTFLLWGAVQLMPQKHLAERLGSVVIVLYVIDLAWTNFSSMNSQKGS